MTKNIWGKPRHFLSGNQGQGQGRCVGKDCVFKKYRSGTTLREPLPRSVFLRGVNASSVWILILLQHELGLVHLCFSLSPSSLDSSSLWCWSGPWRHAKSLSSYGASEPMLTLYIHNTHLELCNFIFPMIFLPTSVYKLCFIPLFQFLLAFLSND